MNISVGQRYIECIEMLRQGEDIVDFGQHLFASDIELTINSHPICNNRENLLKQMNEIARVEGVTDLKLLNNFELSDKKVNIVHFEISYKDGVTEVAMTALTYNDDNKIININCVYGEKSSYSWKA